MWNSPPAPRITTRGVKGRVAVYIDYYIKPFLPTKVEAVAYTDTQSPANRCSEFMYNFFLIHGVFIKKLVQSKILKTINLHWE